MASAAFLETFCVDAQGSTHSARIEMDGFWNMQAFSKHDGTSLGPLALSCAFPWGGDAIYLFSSLLRNRPPMEASPPPVAELLLFPPVVPLKWNPKGFQALTTLEWEAMVVTELADRPATCASTSFNNPGEAPTWDAEENFSEEEEDSLGNFSDDKEEAQEHPADEDDLASVASFTSVDSN